MESDKFWLKHYLIGALWANASVPLSLLCHVKSRELQELQVYNSPIPKCLLRGPATLWSVLQAPSNVTPNLHSRFYHLLANEKNPLQNQGHDKAKIIHIHQPMEVALMFSRNTWLSVSTQETELLSTTVTHVSSYESVSSKGNSQALLKTRVASTGAWGLEDAPGEARTHKRTWSCS